jgi:hypothetical protein
MHKIASKDIIIQQTDAISENPHSIGFYEDDGKFYFKDQAEIDYIQKEFQDLIINKH